MRIHISLGELDRAIFHGVLVIYNVDGKLFDPTRLEHTIRHSQGEQANPYTARAVSHEHN
jgi:hypothetical protein